MFKTLLKKYLLGFILTFVGYTFFNWFFSTHFDLRINDNYTNFWIPAVICIVLTYVVFRPCVNLLRYSEKASDFLLWFIIPFTIWIPISFSQAYFKDISYKIIYINKPGDLFNHLNERFFRIGRFDVAPEDYFLIRERHSSGKNGTTLNVSNYYIVPMYNGSSEKDKTPLTQIGYGVRFSTSMHNGFFDKEIQDTLIKEFNIKSSKDFREYDFKNVGYFEKIENNDDAKYFKEAIENNNSFDKTQQNLVIVNRNGRIQDLYERGKNMFFYSTLICLGIGLTTLLLINVFSDKKPSR
jgi:hypothetical protein